MTRILRIRIVVSYFVQGILVSIALLAGYYFLAVKQGYITPVTPFIILSGSMAPTIPVGSLVLVQSQPIYLTGEIVTFRNTNKTYVTHRIDRIDRGDRYFAPATYTMKGDANKVADTGNIHEEQITGKAVFILPLLGYGVSYIKTPKGFLFLIIIPATIIIYEELQSVKRDLFAGVKSFLEKRRRSKEDTPPALPKRSFAALPLVVIFIPLVASLSFAVIKSGSFLTDAEESIGNIITAASSFATQQTSFSDLTSPPTEHLQTDATPTPKEEATPSAQISTSSATLQD